MTNHTAPGTLVMCLYGHTFSHSGAEQGKKAPIQATVRNAPNGVSAPHILVSYKPNDMYLLAKSTRKYVGGLRGHVSRAWEL